MKSYAIIDKDLERTSAVGYLFYYEKSQSFVIELCEDLDEWEAPLLFQGMVKKNIFTIPKEFSLMWVQERIIPSGRQNINSILKNHGLNEYSEIAMLELSGGKCCQDKCYIEEISKEKIPEAIRKRLLKHDF